jgi:hypothetical protein
MPAGSEQTASIPRLFTNARSSLEVFDKRENVRYVMGNIEILAT